MDRTSVPTAAARTIFVMPRRRRAHVRRGGLNFCLAASLCPIREHVCLFRDPEELFAAPWQAGCVLFRQAFDLSGIEGRCRRRRRHDPFGRALSELNIEILCANTSQAKGRVERAHHTLQDRLVKELRLASISTMEAANAFLPAFVQTYNARFAKPPGGGMPQGGGGMGGMGGMDF